MLLTEFDEKKHEDNLINFGREEGREEERIKNIRNMFKLNLSLEIIAKACDVSIDYVLSLKKIQFPFLGVKSTDRTVRNKKSLFVASEQVLDASL